MTKFMAMVAMSIGCKRTAPCIYQLVLDGHPIPWTTKFNCVFLFGLLEPTKSSLSPSQLRLSENEHKLQCYEMTLYLNLHFRSTEGCFSCNTKGKVHKLS